VIEKSPHSSKSPLFCHTSLFSLEIKQLLLRENASSGKKYDVFAKRADFSNTP
jgi:hypothetical protein